MATDAKNERLKERHERVDRILDQTTTMLDQFDPETAAVDKWWPMAIVMGMAALTKSELDEPQDDVVTIDHDLLTGYVTRIKGACLHGGGGPEIVLEVLSEIAYEFNKELSNEIDNDLAGLRNEIAATAGVGGSRSNSEIVSRTIRLEQTTFNGAPGWKASRGSKQAVAATKEGAIDFLKRIEEGSELPEPLPEESGGPSEEDVEAEAKRLYELSDQGAWDDLPGAMKNSWLSSARATLEGKE